MRLVPVVTGQINQGFGWQDWGQIIVLSMQRGQYHGCWSTGYPACWHIRTGTEVGNRKGRIAPADLVALNEHYAKETPCPTP